MYAGDVVRLSLFLFVFVSVSIFNLYMIFALLTGRLRRPLSRKGRVFVFLFAVLFPLQTGCVLYGSFVEPRLITVNEFDFDVDGVTDDSFVCVVHLSDLHVEEVSWREELILKKVRVRAPDCILFTGDYVNYPDDADAALDFLHELDDIAPLVLVAGNVDVRFPGFVERLKEQFTVCDEGLYTVSVRNTQINLVGADESAPMVIEDAVRQLPTSDKGVSILLYHTPDLIMEEYIPHFDLYLCGHTHGGQVRLPLYGAVITFSRYGKEFEQGLYRENGTLLYVNRGLGFEGGHPWIPRVRFLCPSEIAVFYLRKG